jgi:SAM-dependent methyltransferase
MTSTDNIEFIFDTIYANNSWGCKESRSGPSASIKRTEHLRAALPGIFNELKIQSILDCGCGDWNWMKTIDLSGIHYIGCDIVKPLVQYLQETFSAPNVNFQVLNIVEDPPDTADLWLARDLICLFSSKNIWIFFQKFIESDSKYLAVSSVDENDPYKETNTGAWIPLNLLMEPFHLPEPLLRVDDGEQWFLKKWLFIYDRKQIYDWFHLRASKFDISNIPSTPFMKEVTGDRNAHLTNNIPLRKMKLNETPIN